MITQSIRTSKYTTTIDIPAEKLQTKAKFIQIEKNPYQRQEIISIPNPCYGKQQQRRQISIETKLMIEQLQQAYNQDVQALENQISSMKTSQDIERLKFQNEIQQLKKEREAYIKRVEISQSQLQKTKNGLEDKAQNLQKILKSKDQQLFAKDTEIQRLKREITDLKIQVKEKDSLLSSKFRDFETQKDRKYLDERRTFESRIDLIRRQNQQAKGSFQLQLKTSQNESDNKTLKITQLEKQITTYKDEISQIKRLNTFQNNEIETYIKNLKDLESQKKSIQSTSLLLHEKIEQQNIQIQKLLEEMRQQRIYIETHAQVRSLDHSEEVKVVTEKLHEYSAILDQRDKQCLENKTQYLLKLQQIDEEKQISRVLKQEISHLNNQISSLKLEIKTFKDNQEHLKNELTKKIFEYNELLNRPPEHIEVKIQKNIQKKEYINELEIKITEFEKIIEDLKIQNESYVEEIQRKVKQVELQKTKQQQLIKTIEQLKIYISNREKSIGWTVEREIMKDVEISKEAFEKFNGYKVFVKNTAKSEQCQSNINMPGINIKGGVSFCGESKLQQILEKKQLSSAIQMSKDQLN